MEVELGERIINEICSYLRMMDFLNKHMDHIKSEPEMLIQYEKLAYAVKSLMSNLSEEHIDQVLEIHKIQAEAIEKKLARKEKRDKKKQNTKLTK